MLGYLKLQACNKDDELLNPVSTIAELTVEFDRALAKAITKDKPKQRKHIDVGRIEAAEGELFTFGTSTTEMDEGGKKAFNRETKEFSARDL